MPTPPETRARWGAGVFAGLWGLYTALVIRFWFVTDDAFITFRYARNLVQGEGLRYNSGVEPPVEGFSNPLWVAVCAVMEGGRLDPRRWAPALAFVTGSVLLWRLWGVLRGPVGLPVGWAAPVLAFAALSPAYAVWSSSGLETLPMALLLFLAVERLEGKTARGRGGWAWIPDLGLGAGLALVRVEGVGWAAVVVLLAWLRGRASRSRLLALAGGAAAAFGGYLAFRLAWFESWVSNTAAAKVAWSLPHLERGVDYVISQVLTLPVLVLPLAVLPLLLRRRRGLEAVLYAGFFVWAAVVGGDHMPMGRLLVPALPLGAVALGRALAGMKSPQGPRVWAAVLGLGLAVSVLPVADAHAVPQSWRAAFHFRWNTPHYASETAIWRWERHQTRIMTRIGQALRQRIPEGESIVLGAIGVVGYVSELFVWDRYGLVNREVARRPVDPDRLLSPGHDKRVEIWHFLPQEPTILFLQLIVAQELRPAVAPFVGDLEHRRLTRRYVLDVWPLGTDDRGVPRYLVLIRRIPEGVSPRAAWERFAEKLDAAEGRSSG